jgi:hypothetical protein
MAEQALNQNSARNSAPAVEALEATEVVLEKRMATLLAGNDSPEGLVSSLKAHATQMRKERGQNSKDLKNAVKRAKRLRERAKALSDADLIAVLRMRTEKKNGDGKSSEVELNNGRARDAADNMDVSENTQVRTPDLDEKSD